MEQVNVRDKSLPIRPTNEEQVSDEFAAKVAATRSSVNSSVVVEHRWQISLTEEEPRTSNEISVKRNSASESVTTSETSSISARMTQDAQSLSPSSEAHASYERTAVVTSFDNTERISALLSRPDRYKQLFGALSPSGVISRGAGLSYSLASASSQGRSILSARFNRFLGFDAQRKVVRVEPGVTLGSLFEFAVAHSLLPPVLPGYPLVTVGGAVAMNIHGKNQFRVGNFGDHVRNIVIYHPDAGEITCGPELNPHLFRLTLGGFGLTGHIISVDVSLVSLTGGGLTVERHDVGDLVEAGHLMENLANRSDYTYSWHNLNLRGRRFGSGTVYSERPCDREISTSAKPRISFFTTKPLPWRFYNRLTVSLLCAAYQMKEKLTPRTTASDFYSAFFPFVGKESYFRLYGKKGFREYQALFPRERWEEACSRIGEAILQTRAVILLASIKIFRGEPSFLNFSGNGICLALDTPNGPSTAEFFAKLDEITVDLGGIANISKDGRLSATTARAMYGDQYERFRSALRDYDPQRHFQSELRRRLDL
jgi:decaprenylphospho-beta-D-ribofuranose 2-oxidase